MSKTLSTCAVCGATIEHVAVPAGSGVSAFWQHTTLAVRTEHTAEPDDSAVSGPDRSDLPTCTGCHHPEHDEGECEELVSTGRYGSDGVLEYVYCECLHAAGATPAPVAAVAVDPWMDPDAAARNDPPPF